jgi:hypothetical protein
MEKNLRLYVLLALVLAVVFVVQDRAAPDAAPLAWSARATVTGSELIITGAMNVPDGARIVYRIIPQPAGTTEEAVDGVAHEGWVAITGGRFSEAINVEPLPSGEIAVQLIFQVVSDEGSQPAEVIRQYGALGEYMTGESVTQEEFGRRAELLLFTKKP